MLNFSKVTTISQLKKEYRRLAALYHPDRGGDLSEMQKINKIYLDYCEKLKNSNKKCTVDFSNIALGDTVYVNGTESEVIMVTSDYFRVVAKGRTRQAVFDKKSGNGRYNGNLFASYDNRHKKPA